MHTSNSSRSTRPKTKRPPLTKEQVLAISAKYPFKEFYSNDTDPASSTPLYKGYSEDSKAFLQALDRGEHLDWILAQKD